MRPAIAYTKGVLGTSEDGIIMADNADSTTVSRPLSPHLGIYRFPLSAVLSISHRISGVALSAGLLVLVLWLWGAAYAPKLYDVIDRFLEGFLGQAVLCLWSFALFFHLCSGIRHLFWDIGKGFDLATTHRTDKFVIIGSLALTAAAWILS